jgi:DNA invertase Pin-like site-specific DNA recombinase
MRCQAREPPTGGASLTPMPNIRAALYCRVSTTDQNNALQIRELTEYVQRRGWELVDTYQDTISGAKASRPLV